MAEVLPPLMQSSSTITMLRPSSADAFPPPPQQYQHHHHHSQSPRLGQPPRPGHHGHGPSPPQSAYRGAPVQPYAFQNTPHLRPEQARMSSAPPAVATPGSAGGLPKQQQHPFGHAPSASITSSSDSSSVPSAKDDSVMGSQPGSLIDLSAHLPDLSFTPFDPQPAKVSPDRYRRPQNKRTESNPSAAAKAAAGSSPPSVSPLAAPAATASPHHPMQRRESVDDLAMHKKDSELAKRYRRRSLNTLDTQGIVAPAIGAPAAAAAGPASGHGPSATSTPTTIRPVSFQSASSADDGAGSAANRLPPAPLQRSEPSRDSTGSSESAPAAPQSARGLAVPSRGSSADANKRLAHPSPLSKQAVGADHPTPAASATPTTAPPKPMTYAAAAQAGLANPSPAAAQLAAVSDKDLNKGMKSRLRRAFSFGPTQELRKTAGENSEAAVAATTTTPPSHNKLTKEQPQPGIDDELDAEQLEIARRQEAAGIGANIYSGQGGFSGSTDNLSISSTASSASMMLRKMGRGAKKGARGIKGLFRPKSVIGVPAADGPIPVAAPAAALQPSVAQVSMVTVEAERHNVNVNADPAEKSGGGTGFPKLERNSLDVVSMRGLPSADAARGSADTGDSHSRRSIVGSDKDRAEVLAAVRKGILKRSGTASPQGSPTARPHDASATPVPPTIESPASSMPSTPKDGVSQRRPSLNGAVGDYFSSRLQPSLTAKSMPCTPNGTVRNISFSPRIQFHDVWSSAEYDRRGEIATCNRLTPMLAQQIKEELNTFKMEMEVHELSKPHTHFF